MVKEFSEREKKGKKQVMQMETEIRRAKRKDNGKWVTGYYWCNETDKKHFIISRKRLEIVEIDPATLCRCTGRQDLSGEEVFQGDIIESIMNGIILAGNMVIRYGTYQSYCPVDEEFMDSIGFYVSRSGCPDMPLGPLEEYAKVIGNIFDPPDLVEEKKGNSQENECKTVTEIIQEVREEVCTRLCKYPERYTPEEWENGAEEICKDCPLDRL